MNARLAGRIVASLLFLFTVGIIALALYRNGLAPGGGTGSANGASEASGGAVETLSGAMEPVPLTSFGLETDRGVVSIHDPDTGELDVMLTYESLEPLPNGLLVMSRPMAWIFEGETIVLVEAAEGQVHWPSRDREPESGTLNGGVEMSVFASGRELFTDDQTTREQMGEAAATMETASIHFNAVLMELTTLDPIELTAPGLVTRGDGLTVRVSEIDRTLKLLRVNNYHSATFDPVAMRAWQKTQRDRKKQLASTTSSEDRPPTVSDPELDQPPDSNGSAAAPEPRIDLYHARFAGEVHVTDSIRSLDAEQIDLWARLEDGSLPDGAIGSFDRITQPQPQHRTDPEDGAERPGDKTAPEEAEQNIIEFTGSGPLEIRPIREEPQQLAQDDVYLQIQSPKSNAVVARDGQSGAQLRCVTLGYGATSRKFSTLGLAGTGVTASLPGVFEAVVGRFDQDLTSGEGSFPGPGVITFATKEGAEADAFGASDATIRWQDGCAFELDTLDGPVGSTNAIVPLSVRLTGRVEATFGGHEVRGGEAVVTMERSKDPVTGENGAVIRSITVRESARLVSDGFGRIAGNEMTLLFDHTHPNAEPVIARASASGGVIAEDERGRVQAESLTATFDAAGQAVLLTAREQASVSSPEGYTASGDDISIDLVHRTAVLTGGASLGQTTDDYIQSLRGEQISLDELAQVVEVHGAGFAEYATPKRSDPTHDQLKVEWSEGMRFNNLSGQADFLGAALITAERTRPSGDLERVIGEGSRLTVHLTPYTPEGARRLLRVEIEERVHQDGTSSHAELDLRQFADGRAERLEGLLNLRGPRIVYDAQVHRLIVPEPGTLLIDDRRTDAGGERGASADDDFPEVRGSTGFWWDGALTLDIRDGAHEALMQGRVRMVHQPRGESDRLEMECERLTARIAPDGGGNGAENGSLTLEEVLAEEAVFVRNGGLELVADTLRYDGNAQRVIARATTGNRITVLDAVQRSHFVAEEVALDILSGRWTITRGAAIAMPVSGP
jgi:hypothetical protein